jgi:hypothetical protein
MGWKKRHFVNKALEKVGYANYVFDNMPEQQESVLQSLDAMMATWDAEGIKLGYPIPSSPDASKLDDESGVPDISVLAIYLNLAILIAPDFGKTISPEVKTTAKNAKRALLGFFAMPQEMQYPATLPQGQGNKPWRRTNAPFVIPPTDNLQADNGNQLEFE